MGTIRFLNQTTEQDVAAGTQTCSIVLSIETIFSSPENAINQLEILAQQPIVPISSLALARLSIPGSA